ALGPLPGPRTAPPATARRYRAGSFGGGWGPVLVPSGIGGAIGLEEWSGARLAEVRPTITVDEGRGVVDLRAVVERADLLDDSSLTGGARLLDPAGRGIDDLATSVAADEFDLGLSAEDAQLWWPRGCGGQPLYTIVLELLDADHDPLDSRIRRIGFRTAGVVEEPDEIGTSFTIVVNDSPILAKGANWIPDDAFPSRLSAEDYRASIIDAY